MTFEQLNYFIQTAKALSITRAANSLFISHSALSKSISSLERELDVQLFIRDNQAITLTPAGQFLLEQGQYILRLWNDTQQQMHVIDNSHIGTISICMPPLFEHRLFSIMTDIGRKYPDVNFLFHNVEPLRALDALYNHQVDLAITFSYQLPELSDDLVFYDLFEDSFCAVVNDTHPLAGKTSLSMADLRDECIIFPPKVGSIQTDMSLLAKIAQPQFLKSYHADNLEDVFFQIATNKGISLLPKSTMIGRNSNWRLIPLSDVSEPFYVSLVRLENNANPLSLCITREILNAFYNKTTDSGDI